MSAREHFQQTLTWAELFSNPQNLILGGVAGLLLLVGLAGMVLSWPREEKK